jgi:hypothetical protein
MDLSNLRYSFIFISEPENKSGIDLRDISLHIKENFQRHIPSIVTGLISRIMLLEVKKIFYADGLVINNDDLHFQQNEDLINKVSRLGMPKRLNELVNFNHHSLDFNPLVESFKSTHQKILLFYR